MVSFICRHLDGELITLIETTVPPVDLGAISAFRASMGNYQKQAGSGGAKKAPQVEETNFKACERPLNDVN